VTEKSQNSVSIVFGVVFIAAILALVSYFPCPSKIQVTVFRIVLAIAAGACAAIIPGFFEFQFQSVVKAGGAIGVFALVFLKNPAGFEQRDDCNCSIVLRGKVLVNKIPAKDVSVRCHELKNQDETDTDGEFDFKSCKDNIPANCSFLVTYRGHAKYFQPKRVLWDSLVLEIDTSTSFTGTDERSLKYTFDNIADKSISYGGEPYCRYQLTLSEIHFYLNLDDRIPKVKMSNITLKAKEDITSSCPYQGVPLNTHVYNMSSSMFDGKDISISFVPDQLNNPSCVITFTGKKVQNAITGVFTIKRIDMPEPKLNFQLSFQL
jgi:hypothetical protein